MHKHLQHFLEATWESPVFDDTFAASASIQQRLQWAEEQLGAIAKTVTAELGGKIVAGLPELGAEAASAIAAQEILPKTLAFCPALTVGELHDIPRLSAVSTAVGLMYWGDQTMDRGDLGMAEAIMLLGRPAAEAKKMPAPVQARLKSLRHIENRIAAFARPEDVPRVLACFYDQVLRNEVRTHSLSLDYIAGGEDPAFIAQHGRRLAEISTVSAGFPGIASSLYAIYRQHDPSLPSLEEIYTTPALTKFLQVCNVVVRIWDDLGDWQMDRGDDPQLGEFVINPFNQYDPAFVERFCELAHIDDAARRAALQKHFAAFHESDAARSQHETYVLTVLRSHIRAYLEELNRTLPQRFQQYVTLCKRVMEIGYVNRVGDIALMAGAGTAADTGRMAGAGAGAKNPAPGKLAGADPWFQKEYAAKLAVVAPGVAAFAQQLQRETRDEDRYIQATIEGYVSLLNGNGKRVRAALTLCGYQCYGGGNDTVARMAPAVVEACHAYLLVMDDVADNSSLRRGIPTAHVHTSAFLDAQNIAGNTKKIGQDMAQSGALYAQHTAQALLMGLPVSAERCLLAATILNEGLARTGLGQLRDISPIACEDVSLKTILQTATYKTAYYTFLLPLQVGAALAGATKGQLQHFKAYSLHAGLAFQMQDDIIGSFGDEAATGKSPLSDIQEGKKTFLVASALQQATPAQRAVLQKALGSPALTGADFAACLDIIRSTGALAKAEKLVEKHTRQALAALDAAAKGQAWPAAQTRFLRELALYGAGRQA